MKASTASLLLLVICAPGIYPPVDVGQLQPDRTDGLVLRSEMPVVWEYSKRFKASPEQAATVDTVLSLVFLEKIPLDSSSALATLVDTAVVTSDAWLVRFLAQKSIWLETTSGLVSVSAIDGEFFSDLLLPSKIDVGLRWASGGTIMCLDRITEGYFQGRSYRVAVVKIVGRLDTDC